MANSDEGAKTKAGGGQFETFLGAVDALIKVWTGLVKSQIEENDRKLVMGLYEEASRTTWGGVASELSKIYRQMGPAGRADLDNAVVASGMLLLVEHATTLASSGQLVSTPSILDLGTIFEKIKDFILCIFDCLDINLPCFILCLLSLLDNFFRLYVGPVSQEYADYYLKIEGQTSQNRLHMLRERKMRKGCSCSGARDQD
jgi:hypothetical protein